MNDHSTINGMEKKEESLSVWLNALDVLRKRKKEICRQIKIVSECADRARRRERVTSPKPSPKEDRNREITRAVLSGKTMTDMAKLHKVTPSTIRNVVQRQCSKMNKALYKDGLDAFNPEHNGFKLPPPLAWLRENAVHFMP